MSTEKVTGRPGASASERGADSISTFELAPGFHASGTACGLKPSGALDLALVHAPAPCSAAGVFTTNRVQAAPVVLDREVLARASAHVRAVIANSGCANACTGERGLRDARRMAALTAEGLGCTPDQVLVLSTGVIGRPLEMEKLTRGIATLVGRGAASGRGESDAAGGRGESCTASGRGESGAALVARAIMTTDTRPKVASETLAIGAGTVTIAGFAKGAGMIHPDLATLLAVVTTDARLAPPLLDRALRAAVERSFNRISVDGDTSTNDTVLVLASGVSGIEPRGADLERFGEALARLCTALARQVARDGEGATRLVEVRVTGARDEREAHTVANRIACSSLVKTAIHGGDPNWGRILAAAGASGAEIVPECLELAFGATGGPIRLVASGMPADHDARAASEALARDPVEIHLDLGLGTAESTVWTCDLSAEYVAINAHYTT